MFKLAIVLFATVAYASAGLISDYSGYGGTYGAAYGYGHSAYPSATAVLPHLPVQYIHNPPATSYANTYKVAYAAPAITKVAIAPTLTKLAYTSPSVYSSPALSYGHGYGYGYAPSVSYGHGYGGYGGYGSGYNSYVGHGSGYGLGLTGYTGHGGLSSGYGLGYSGYSGYGGLGYGYGHGGYLH